MAKKRKNRNDSKANHRKNQLRTHIADLNLSGEADYLDWCAQHGFRVTPNKSLLNRRQELRHYYEHSAFSSLKRSRGRRQYADTLIAFCHDHTILKAVRESDDERATYACQCLLKRIRTASGRATTGRFLTIVNERSSLLQSKQEPERQPFIDGLIAIACYRELWVRPIESWSPRTHNTDRQFFSLIHHLLTQYPMPAFFDSVWLENSGFARRCQRWYVQIAFGQNPRYGESPVALTTRMAHYFMQAPASCSIIEALRWGQIKALGGDQNLFDAVRTSRLGLEIKNDEFWLSVLRFFIAHPFLDRTHVGPICDFLHHQKFEGQIVYVDNYQRRELSPPQPNLSMKGRTPETLLAQVDRWHRMLGRGDGLGKMSWKPTLIEPMKLISGKGEKTVIWTISELLSHKALAREGAAMDHCVVSYARSCLSRQCSIWSMTSEDVSGLIRRRQTVEVRKQKIVQCRGRNNRNPDSREYSVLEGWAREAQLGIDLPKWTGL